MNIKLLVTFWGSMHASRTELKTFGYYRYECPEYLLVMDDDSHGEAHRRVTRRTHETRKYTYRYRVDS